MESVSFFHWSIVLVFWFAIGYPFATILKRMGYSGWWVIVAFIPLFNIIGLWRLSYAQWPNMTGPVSNETD